MNYSRAHFVLSVVISTKPWRAISVAEAPEFLIEDQGPHLLAITKAGSQPVYVPWSNISSAQVAPPTPVVVTPPEPQPPPPPMQLASKYRKGFK